MSNGQGCTCNAWSAYECCCEHVDWRSEREVELEIENAALKAELASLTNGVKIQIPSNTMEYAFSSWHRRGYNKAKDEMHQEVERLKAELAEAKKDAEMFSFVKSRAYVGISHNKECLWVLRGIYEVTYDPVKIHGFDAAILSAMKGK